MIPLGEVEIRAGLITAVRTLDRPRTDLSTHDERHGIIDAAGRVLMPAFVDAHTHACFVGSRLDEWQQKLRGVPYLDILRAGGGIMATVRAVRDASQAQLTAALRERIDLARRSGTLTHEVKSGYGLSAEHELKMLRAIRDDPRAIPTALLGHAIDPDDPTFIDRTINDTLPAVSAEFPGIPIDAYCETGAWSVNDTVRLLAAARALGHPIRVHADQFNSLGMIDQAIALGAASVDHLEASPTDALDRLAASSTFGVMLPVCGFHLDGRYANAQYFVRAGGALVLASNDNPGSAPSCSMPLVIALAVRHMGLSTAEAIAATTVNPAELLGLRDRGTIAPGQRADLILLRHTDERRLAFEVDAHPIDRVFAADHHHVSSQHPRPIGV
ncbi:imidazolonepropionase [Leptolyngbya sp. 15MV]|nr:imidazolonepropionase [Leptolyngbya sp. 15MV]